MDQKAFEFRMKPRKEKSTTDEVEAVNPSDVTVLPKSQGAMSMSAGSLPAGGKTAGGASGFAVLEIVNTALGLVDTTIKTIGEVKLAKEQTKQVRAQAEAFIAQAKEQTEQVHIQEVQTTKRFELQMNQELRGAKLKLIEEKKRLDNQLKQRKLSHTETMQTLKICEEPVRVLTSTQEELVEQFKEARTTGIVVDPSIQQKLIENSRELVKLVEQIRHLRQ